MVGFSRAGAFKNGTARRRMQLHATSVPRGRAAQPACDARGGLGAGERLLSHLYRRQYGTGGASASRVAAVGGAVLSPPLAASASATTPSTLPGG
jgi:hypothetical protein